MKICVATVLLVSCGALVSSQVLPAVTKRLPTSPRKQAQLSELIDAVRPSVVQIVSYFGTQLQQNQETGTGFFVNSDGIVVTAKHVISHGSNVPCDTAPLKPMQPPDFSKTEAASIQADSVHIAWPQRSTHTEHITIMNSFRTVRARIIACDDKHDIALLAPEYNPLTFSDTSAPPLFQMHDTKVFMESEKRAPAALSAKAFRDGDPIFTSGYPLANTTLITTSGYIASSAPIRVDEKTGKFEDVYWADIHVNPGNSGGPTFSLQTGAVLGMVRAHQAAPVRFNEDGGPPAYTLEGRPNGQGIQRFLVSNAGIAEIIPVEFVQALLRANKLAFTTR